MVTNGKLAGLVVGYLLAFHPISVAVVPWSIACIFVKCSLPEPCSATGAPARNVTSLKIVFPGVGQTGTTSVSQAVRQLGYRSYHIEERSLFAPDIVEEFPDSGPLASRLSRCATEAVSLEPQVDSLPYVVETSPDAKFILTFRDYFSWIGSTSQAGWGKDRFWNYIGDTLSRSSKIFPWNHIYDAATGGFSDLLARGEPFAGEGQGSIKTFMAYKIFGVYDSPSINTFDRGTFKIGGQEEAYLAHMNEVRQLVPPERLLVFDVRQHGWKELTEFLGRPAPPEGTPFPRTRNKDSRTNDINFYRGWKNGLAACFIWSFLHALNYWILIVAVRAAAMLGSRLASALAAACLVVADVG